MNIQIESYTKVTKRELKTILEEALDATDANISFEIQKKDMIFRGIDPTILIASIAAVGTLASGVGALLSALLRTHKKNHAHKIVIKMPDNEMFELSMNPTPSAVQIAIAKMSDVENKSLLASTNDSGRITIMLQ